jgi:hypothetical protein
MNALGLVACSLNQFPTGHWGHQPTGFYYNGLHHDDVLKGNHLGINREYANKSPLIFLTDLSKIGMIEEESLVVAFYSTMSPTPLNTTFPLMQ